MMCVAFAAPHKELLKSIFYDIIFRNLRFNVPIFTILLSYDYTLFFLTLD